MESDRMKLMTEERIRLEKEKAKFPELFPETTWVDDGPFLEALGIHIPHKDQLSRGFLKILPSDFIVEEIDESGKQTNITKEDSENEDLPGETVYATMVKCGLSTLEAVEEIAKILGIQKDKVQYAGIKDKDAITSQQISFRGVSKEDVLGISSPHFFLKNVRTGKGVVQKGGLRGNKFSILIRTESDSNEENHVEMSLKALERVKKEGFYNFFYLQRFGTPRLNNYKWGISILRGDYEKAVRGLISDPGLREIPYFLNKRKEIISHAPDWNKVLEELSEFPLIFPSEIKVVNHLVSHPTDFAGALQRVEEQVVLWVSAVASLLYNRRISSYIMAGMEPPEFLPLFLSEDKNDWLPYQEDLEEVGIFPPNLNNLKHFRNISTQHKDIKTKDVAEIHSAEITDEGLAVSFTLGKGEYATTFLSHFITLLGGKVSEDITEVPIDVKKSLGEESSEETLKYFKDLNVSRK